MLVTADSRGQWCVRVGLGNWVIVPTAMATQCLGTVGWP